jgi:SAM-dependent methyltransferase
MIELAQKGASENHITNATFMCHDVSDIPAEDGSFSIVICKSAFHHIHDYDKVLSEMIRCCESGGKVSIQDVVALEDARVNDFFEELESQVDISHHVCLSKESIQALYEKHNLGITWTFELTVELNFRDYLTHAVQSEEGSVEIERLLRIGLSDSDICNHLVAKDGELYYKRDVFLIMGKKR